MRLPDVCGCRGIAVLALAGLLWLMPMRAQLVLPKEGEAQPSFEVATIKPSPAGAQMARIARMPDGYRLDNIPLNGIIQDAYGAVSDAQLIGGPQALLDQHFDVLAKMDAEDAARYKAESEHDQERAIDLMMQSLLRDRFQMKVHIETRELPVYALVVVKAGPKLRPTAPAPSPDPAAETAPDAPMPEVPKQLPHRAPPNSSMMRMDSSGAQWTVSGETMEEMAAALTQQAARVVIDKTGLTGKYDWYLEWMPEGMQASASDSTAPGLFTALQEQLGLKLEPQKAPVQVIVIDRLEAPSPN